MSSISRYVVGSGTIDRHTSLRARGLVGVVLFSTDTGASWCGTKHTSLRATGSDVSLSLSWI